MKAGLTRRCCRFSGFPAGTVVTTLAAAAVLSGCAGSLGGAGARRYERPGLDRLPLRSIDVAITVAGPPTTSAPRFNVPSFAPPTLDSAIRPPAEEPATRAALVARLRQRLADAGFRVRMIHSGVTIATQKDPGIDTSTTAVEVARAATATSAVATEIRTPDLEVERPLGPGVTVRDLLTSSNADAVLVVRVVPVDAFYVFLQNEENRLLDVGGGTVPQAAIRDRPDVRGGRLLVGQAFLFDRKTGARLWTRHLPDLPEDGRIMPNDPFLSYGYVAPPEAGQPSNGVRAEQSSAGFVKAMFADFPAPNAGDARARTALDELDIGKERRAQAFFDEDYFVFEIGGNYTYQTVELEGFVGGEPTPDFETGFVAPNGAIRFEPRFSYVAPGGLTVGAGGQVGVIPSRRRQRSFFRDGDDDADRDLGGQVSVTNGLTFGVDGRVGYLFAITPDVLVWPSIGGFWERWTLDASPDTIIPSGTIDRVGALVHVGLVWRLNSVWFTKAGGGFRAGVASQGGEIFGAEVGLSLGFFL